MIIGDLYFGSASSSWTLDPDVVIPLIGVFVALGSAAIALFAYLRAKSRSAEARINAMFREMLAMEFQLFCTPFYSEIAVEKAVERFDRYKLWVLEELWLWVDRRKDRLPRFGERRRRGAAANDDWADVISVHLIRCGEKTKERPWGAEAGYHAGFQAFVEKVYDPNPEETKEDVSGGSQNRKPLPSFWERALARRHGWPPNIANASSPLTLSASSPDASTLSIVGDLEKLAQLKATGAISDAEFAMAKARLLGIST